MFTKKKVDGHQRSSACRIQTYAYEHVTFREGSKSTNHLRALRTLSLLVNVRGRNANLATEESPSSTTLNCRGYGLHTLSSDILCNVMCNEDLTVEHTAILGLKLKSKYLY